MATSPDEDVDDPHYRRRIVSPDPKSLIRRRQVPDRIVADKVVLARPQVDEAAVLAGPVALVWVALDTWTTQQRIRAELTEGHPELEDDECERIVRESIEMLDDEGLLERRDR